MVDGDGIVGNDESIMLATANGGPFNDQLVGTAFEVFVSKVQLGHTTAGCASDVSHEADDEPRSAKMSPFFCEVVVALKGEIEDQADIEKGKAGRLCQLMARSSTVPPPGVCR